MVIIVYMEKEIYFINGMPRSGSTLLCNILSQNPDFHATPTSGLSDIVYDIHEIWQKNPSIKASETPEKKLTVIRDLIYSYHRDHDRPVVFNKSRGWAPLVELLEMSLQRNVKILTTTRNLPSILASFEKLYRKELKMVDSPMQRNREMSIISNRVNIWANGVVGTTFNTIQDAFMRGYKDRFHLIDYDKLTTDPRGEMVKVYSFLEKSYFDHDFSNIVQYTFEKDIEHGFTDLHTIRPVVAPQKDDSREILGSLYNQFANFHYNF
jgi:sulfotransferase